MGCAFENCNQADGHSGPHGFQVAPGLIVAPHGGGEGKLREAEIVELECNCCGSSMMMQKFEHGGARFKCSKCDQLWSFYPDGRSNCVVIAKLFPSGMKEGSKIYDDFLGHRMKECLFDAKARTLCGLESEASATEQISRMEAAIAAKRMEISARRWWKFW